MKSWLVRCEGCDLVGTTRKPFSIPDTAWRSTAGGERCVFVRSCTRCRRIRLEQLLEGAEGMRSPLTTPTA